MKFELKKASDWNFREEVEIKTIEDLKDLSDKFSGEELILRFYDKNNPRIIIYDDYIE